MADPKREELVHSVSDFQSRLKSTSGGEQRLFRGQNTDSPLLPRLVRLAKAKGMSLEQMKNVEQKMLERFRKESAPMLGVTKVRTDLELLSIAQHYGMPTRLLDWTANPLAGLWFAVSASPLNDQDIGVIWVLDRPNVKTLDIEDNIFKLDKTYFFQPRALDPRIVAQSAWLSIHRYAVRSNSKQWFLPLEEHDRYRGKLRKFHVPRELFDSIRNELRQLDISHVAMFPDLSGLSADIEADLIKTWRILPSI